jgi:hypothetical protein
MKTLSLFTIVIALCLGGAMIQSGRASDRRQSSSVVASHATRAPFRDGLYLGKLAADRGGELHISTGRWAAEADRASFTAGFQQGYHDGLVRRAAKANSNQG